MLRLALLSPVVALALATGCRSNKNPVEDSGVTELPTVDADGDGYAAEDDCDDNNSVVNPGGQEICDGVDNDCDGIIDEDVTTTFYGDTDGDGFGDAGAATEACDAPSGYVAIGSDCDDSDADSFPGAAERCDGADNDCDGTVDEDVQGTWYADADGDSYGDPDSAYEVCDPPPGYVSNADDCDDTDASALPGGVEVCDEADNDCDGTVDEDVTTTYYQDTDSDNYGISDVTTESCDRPTGYAELPGDCDDSNDDISPNGVELCDGVDNDCDGVIDEDDAADAATWYVDADADGYGTTATTRACAQPSGYTDNSDDCDDTTAAVSPAEAEVCNTVDDDCNGWIDDADPGLTDGSVWYLDYDRDGYGGSSITTTACTAPAWYVDNADDCNDFSALAAPDGTEVCDSLDNDCDGTVDEDDATDAETWYYDGDSDTYGDPAVSDVACEAPDDFVGNDDDCDDSDADIRPDADETWYDGVDVDCDGDTNPDPCGELPEETTVTADETCGYSYAAPSAWSVVQEWSSDSISYSAGSSYVEVMMTPVVGQVNDDNGDGVVDEQDIPDIAYTTFSGSGYSSAGYLRVLSGDGSGELFSLSSSSGYAIHASGGVAIGDIDDDGWPDIVTTSTGGYVLAIEGDGTAKWSSSTTVYAGYCYPAIHDLDGDGDVEILACEDIFDKSGSFTATTGSIAYYAPAVADIDLDGEMEIITGNAIYAYDGTVEVSTGYSSAAVAVGNFDSDDEGEIVLRDGTYVYLLDDDGALLWRASAQGYGYPCVADLDGDGEMEIGVGGRATFTALDTDGSTMWTQSVYDESSGTMGCSAFDFDGDGAAEVVHMDRTDLFIWDGATGTELYNQSSAASGSLFEYPVIADVDNDGQAEVVFPSNNYSISGLDGVFILGESNGEWAPARTLWNQVSYGVGQLNADMSVPASPDAPWLSGAGFREQRTPSGPADAAPDWAVTILGACEDCSAADLELYVAVENVGSSFGPAGVSVALYAVDGSTETLLDTQTLSMRVEPGVRTAPLSFSLDAEDIGSDGLRVVVDGDDAHHECDEDNNDATWDTPTCE